MKLWVLAIIITAVLVQLSCGSAELPALDAGDIQYLDTGDDLLTASAAEVIRLNGHDCCTLADLSTDEPRAGCSDPDISACVCEMLPGCCDQAWAIECVVQTLALCGNCNALDPTVAAVLNADTDGDGFSDLDEINAGMDPNDPSDGIDTDGDGIPNRYDVDIDGDGIPNLLDPDIDGDGIANTADADIDGDGLANAVDADFDGVECAKDGDCDDDNDCTTGKCSGGLCLFPTKSDGTKCGDVEGNPCLIETCKGGQCSDKKPTAMGTPCGSQVNTKCNPQDTCDGNGKCQVNFARSGTTCNDGDECTSFDICDGTGNCAGAPVVCDDDNECTTDECSNGLCVHDAEPEGTACGNQADTLCDSPDSCDGQGVCLPNFADSGSPCGDDHEDECDEPDTCDGQGMCQANFAPEGATCGNMGTECRMSDACDGMGSCEPGEFMPAETPCGDPPDGECDEQDTCDGDGNCQERFKDEGTMCDLDESLCSIDECDGEGSCEQVGDVGCPVDLLCNPETGECEPPPP